MRKKVVEIKSTFTTNLLRKEWKQVLKCCLTKEASKGKWCLKTAFFNIVYIQKISKKINKKKINHS